MGNVGRGSAGAAGGRFAHVADAFSRIGSDERVSVVSEGDGYSTHVLVEDVELAYECAKGATFEGAVFRSCLFEQVDLLEGEFRDVRGAVVSPEQALDVAQLLEVRIAEE